MRHPATPFESLFIGVIISGFIVFGLTTGNVFLSFGRRVCHDKEPIGFWVAIIAQILMALCALGYGITHLTK